MSFFLFMVFSMIEGIGVFALTLYIFRFNLRKYLVPVIFTILLMNLQSYAIHEDTAFSFIVPVINLIFSTLFLLTIVKVPLLWAMFVGLLGYFAGGFLQTSIIYLSLGNLSIAEVQSVPAKGYLLQTLTGFIGTYVGWILYKFGIGFSFEFEKLRLKWEKYIIIILISSLIVLLGAMMYFKNAVINLLAFMISMLVFLYFSMRRESQE